MRYFRPGGGSVLLPGTCLVSRAYLSGPSGKKNSRYPGEGSGFPMLHQDPVLRLRLRLLRQNGWVDRESSTHPRFFQETKNLFGVIFLRCSPEEPFYGDTCIDDSNQGRSFSRSRARRNCSSVIRGAVCLRSRILRQVSGFFDRRCSRKTASCMRPAMIALLFCPLNTSLKVFRISSGTRKWTVLIRVPSSLLSVPTRLFGRKERSVKAELRRI